MSETLDAAACAELLHCSVDQVEDLARVGELPSVKIGRGWLFVRADLLEYLAERGRKEAETRRAARAPAPQSPNAPTPIRRATSRRRAAPALPVPH